MVAPFLRQTKLNHGMYSPRKFNSRDLAHWENIVPVANDMDEDIQLGICSIVSEKALTLVHTPRD